MLNDEDLKHAVQHALPLRVRSYCHAWGVPVVHSTPLLVKHDGVNFRGPLSCDSKLEPRAIHFVRHPERNPGMIALDILHELSHHIAGNAQCPTDDHEVHSAMLAFEFYSARWLWLQPYRLAWMRGFGLPLYGDWWDAPVDKRCEYISSSLETAVEIGILTRDGRPTFRAPSARL